jgi:hypothetical protein
MLPPALGLLENLQQLRIDYEDLRTPPEEVLNGGTPGILSYLKHVYGSRHNKSLALEQYNLLFVPPELASLAYLEHLSLNENAIRCVCVCARARACDSTCSLAPVVRTCLTHRSTKMASAQSRPSSATSPTSPASGSP